ncbi:hypothetical protein MNV49_002375 [Pseudohyphozyma bogoriensis]|nr:hypothetical protein MNV49_002375 [Pseudohyphozyma bogoriensis]
MSAAVIPKLLLYTSRNSPFCLKVMMLTHELGLSDKVEMDYSVTAHPTHTSTVHSHLIPSGKIPCLVVDSTTPIYGSENICQYLDHLAGHKALPTPGEFRRFEVLTTEALCSQMGEAALALRYERSSELHYQPWITGQLSKITRAIPMLAARPLPDPAGSLLGLDGIAAAIALNYMDKRAADSEWRTLQGGEKLDQYLEAVKLRESWKKAFA